MEGGREGHREVEGVGILTDRGGGAKVEEEVMYIFSPPPPINGGSIVM